MKNIAFVDFIVIICFFANDLLGIIYQATESSHYQAHYHNITFSETISTCTDYGGKLAGFPDDYNFSVLIASIGLPAYSQFWINGSTYLNCTCLSTFKLHWIVEGINCNNKVYYICRQPFATSGSLVKTDKSLTWLQTPVQQLSPSLTLNKPFAKFSLGFTSLQRSTEELWTGSKTLNTQVLELSPTSTSKQMPVSELSPSATSLRTAVEELPLTSITLQTKVQELSPTLFSGFSPTSVSTVFIQENHSRNDSSFNLASTLSPTLTPFSQSPEKGLTIRSETAHPYSTIISLTKFTCVQVCCSDVFRYCNNHTRENQRNISISELINQLSIDKKCTSKQSRRLYSAYDSRTSSKAMGVGAMLIICSILTCIVAMDLPRIIAFFYNR